MTIEMTCPTCGSHDISKNGTTALVNRLLHEKIPLAGIARALEVSESWLQGYANATSESVSQTAEVIPKPKGPLRVQMDELWSFVNNKGNQPAILIMAKRYSRPCDSGIVRTSERAKRARTVERTEVV